jgi:hypothetical protein
MGEVSTIGLDIAKSVFQVHGVQTMAGTNKSGDGVNATNERSALRCVGKQPQSHRNGRLFLDRAFEGTFRHISGRVLFLPHETNVAG